MRPDPRPNEVLIPIDSSISNLLPSSKRNPRSTDSRLRIQEYLTKESTDCSISTVVIVTDLVEVE